MKSTYSIALYFIFLPFFSIGQVSIIKLKNPSFEDLPRAGKAPLKWFDCGFPGETPPDVSPVNTFGVSRPAFDGSTYLGMVVRDTDTWERVSQKLSDKMIANQCYDFSIFLCRSPLYESRSQKTKLMTNYVQPVQLIVWGGDKHCAKREKLGETDIISNFEWEEFDFTFTPTKTHTYILFEAFYETPVLYPYNGNILLDNASDIFPVNCDFNTTDTNPKEESFYSEDISYQPNQSIDKATSSENRPTNPYYSKKGIYEIPSTLAKEDLELLIKAIELYLNSRPKYRAEISIKDRNIKAARITRDLIIERMRKRGWEKNDYLIFID